MVSVELQHLSCCCGSLKCSYRLRQILDAIVPAFTVSIRMLNKASPYIFAVAGGVYKFYTGLSSNMSTALYGFALSFFGGSFPVAIAVRIV
jgi:hypothetical protein